MEPPRKHSAVEKFFKNFVPRLSDGAADFDLTLDMDLMFEQPEETTSNKPTSDNALVGVHQKRDLTMEELRLIVSELKNGSAYSEKLTTIMLRGLETTLPNVLYRYFVEHGPQSNWWPIIRMNDVNAPFVEILIKSDLSDQAPCEQLTDYSADQMALCKYVLNQLHAKACMWTQQAVTNGSHQKQQQQARNQQHQQQLHQQRPGTSRPSTHQQPKAVCSGPPKRPPTSLLTAQKPKPTTDKENQRKSLPAPMVCSTPIAQRSRPATASVPPAAKRAPATTSSLAATSQAGSTKSLHDQLNDSKLRLLPARACKSNTSGGTYSRYF